MRRTTVRGLALAGALSVAVAACGGGDSATATTDGQTTTTAPDVTTLPAQTTTASADDPVILISGFAFEVPAVVPVGTAVSVENLDSASHTWTSVDDVFDSGSLNRGETYEFRFDEAGEYEFFCRIHPTMTGTVSVEG